jgi:cell fate (sporulation/competence/biofilm development) regulator YlbF (YheA/YmcA/DUF963 family)
VPFTAVLRRDRSVETVADSVSADELRGMLLMRRREVSRSIQSEMERLRQIESRIAQIETEGRISADDVMLRHEPARRIIAVREVLASFTEARQLLAVLMTNVPRHIPPNLLGALIGVAHSPEFELDRIDLEIGFVLNDEQQKKVVLPDGRKLVQRELSAERMATCVRIAGTSAFDHRQDRAIRRRQRLSARRPEPRSIFTTARFTANARVHRRNAIFHCAGNRTGACSVTKEAL